MTAKDKTEFEQFDKVMGGLLSVSHEDLHKKLEEEKKAKKKKRAKTSPASRASSVRKS